MTFRRAWETGADRDLLGRCGDRRCLTTPTRGSGGSRGPPGSGISASPSSGLLELDEFFDLRAPRKFAVIHELPRNCLRMIRVRSPLFTVGLVFDVAVGPRRQFFEVPL